MVARAWICVFLLLPSGAAAEVDAETRRGREIYQERCVLCHGSRGQGWDWNRKAARPPVPVPNLAEVVPKRSDDYLKKVIRYGGEAVGLTRFMPAFGFNTDEQEIQDVIFYLRSLQSESR